MARAHGKVVRRGSRNLDKGKGKEGSKGKGASKGSKRRGAPVDAASTQLLTGGPVPRRLGCLKFTVPKTGSRHIWTSHQVKFSLLKHRARPCLRTCVMMS